MSINTCEENGHKYDSSEHSQCPYCPDKTVVLDTQSANQDDVGSSNDKTAVMSDAPTSDKTAVVPDVPASDKTAIHKPVPDNQSDQNIGATGRKLVGWLVSFSWNSEGQDYKLREGKTSLGADSKCDIVVGDGEISAHHATILYRGGKFKLKDEFSTNGTLIDGKEIEDQTELEDGNTITIGKADFLFRRI